MASVILTNQQLRAPLLNFLWAEMLKFCSWCRKKRFCFIPAGKDGKLMRVSRWFVGESKAAEGMWSFYRFNLTMKHHAVLSAGSEAAP